jgi:hypothetical protein
MIPDAAQLPAHIINHELARQANEDAAAGISTGFPPRIKMAGKSFALVDGGGTETPVKAKELVEGPDENMYLKSVVLRARVPLQKVWYATKFDPSAEGQSPDCFSNDGAKPDATAPSPQCDTCAACPNNAYGSGTDANGRATAGKACADNKILAVFLPNKGVHSLKITPASLKNWGLYVKRLSSAGIPVGNVFTLIGFDQAETFPILTFQYGGAIPETAVEKLAALAQSPEAEEVITNRIQGQAKAAAPSTTKPKAEAKPKATAAPVEDDLGLDAKPAGKKADPIEEVMPTDTLSDEDIAAELGL